MHTKGKCICVNALRQYKLALFWDLMIFVGILIVYIYNQSTKKLTTASIDIHSILFSRNAAF